MSTPRLSPAKGQQIFVVCDSVLISAGDLSEVLTSLKSFSSGRSSASAKGSVNASVQRLATMTPVRA